MSLCLDDPNTYVIEGCACGGPFQVHVAFWMVAAVLRAEEPQGFRRMSASIRRDTGMGKVPVVTLENCDALTADDP